MNNYTKEIIDNNIEFQKIIKEIKNNETVLEMKNFRQHYETTCYDHCYMASYLCYFICKKFKLDYTSAARAAMVHDLFLYDWRKKQPDKKGLHAFTHGKTAYENASKLFNLNDKEKDIIIKHMWPVTPIPPKYVEGFILTLVDKYCALSESFDIIKSRLFMKKQFRYAYLFLSILIISI